MFQKMLQGGANNIAVLDFQTVSKKCTGTTNILVFDNLKEVVGITEIKALNGQDYPSRTNVFSISGNTVILNVADGGGIGINTTFSVTACGYN